MNAYQLAARARIAKGRNGFIRPAHEYTITVGARRAHTGRNKREAQRLFRKYRREVGEGFVILLRDGKKLA